MTPEQQQPRELYTLEQVQQILDVVRENAVYNDGDFYFKVNIDKLTNTVQSLEPIRSRPHPAPAPTTVIQNEFETIFNFDEFDGNMVEWLKAHDAAIARTARDKKAIESLNAALHGNNYEIIDTHIREAIALLQAGRK